jgi:hypothetical protein
MKKTILLSLFTLFIINLSAQQTAYRQKIDLKGTWQYSFSADSLMPSAAAFSDSLTLPGTTDTNRKGVAATQKDCTDHLTRLFSYVGKAWYRRTVNIPKEWKGRQISLLMERTKPSVVFVDGIRAGSSNDITTPQRFDLSTLLTPGRHQLTILVDNSSGVPKQLYANSHAYTEDTQTNWNGIIGDFQLTATNKTHVSNISVSTDKDSKCVSVDFKINGKLKHNDVLVLSIYKGEQPNADKSMVVAYLNTNGKKMCYSRIPCNVKSVSIRKMNVDNGGKDGESDVNVCLSLPYLFTDSACWSEFHPSLFTVKTEIMGKDAMSETFGMVDFKAHDHHFYVNGTLTFLRGKHDACVFPLTGHTPMDVESWLRYLGKCKDYGINHIRFHSWCPPDAAFTAADELGIYLQPELPFWGGFDEKDTILMRFLHKEGLNIIAAYGHHPSFVMMALGNELWGSIDMMKKFTDDFRLADSKLLFTFGSNYYLGYKGWHEGMDYFTTCRTGGESYGEYNTHVRGSFSFADVAEGGVINHFYPNSSMNFQNACNASPAPVISHETGQFQSFPDFNEIKKFTGVLYPYNLLAFYNRLKDAGMAAQAVDFHRASGLLSAQLYKADIEMDLRTANMAGFQLLDLQDYPGQGSAYVGVLDAFMDSKGFTTPMKWRNFCSPVVPLLIVDKFCFTDSEHLNATVKVANYGGKSLKGKTLRVTVSGCKDSWDEENEQQTVVEKTMVIASDSLGLIDAGTFSADLSGFLKSGKSAGKIAILIAFDGTDIRNNYDIWVYHADKGDIQKQEKGIIITSKYTDEIGKKLLSGASVMLMPDSSECRQNTVGGLFTTDYWNFKMFKTISENNNKPVSPGTLGILTNSKHPIFSQFPTEDHSNWQWFAPIKASRPMILDGLDSTYRPIVQVIDNIERNHKLGLIFEFAVGKGRLLVCMSNLKAVMNYPEIQQLYKSILTYMHSKSFAPTYQLSLQDLKSLLSSTYKD